MKGGRGHPMVYKYQEEEKKGDTGGRKSILALQQCYTSESGPLLGGGRA